MQLLDIPGFRLVIQWRRSGNEEIIPLTKDNWSMELTEYYQDKLWNLDAYYTMSVNYLRIVPNPKTKVREVIYTSYPITREVGGYKPRISFTEALRNFFTEVYLPTLGKCRSISRIDFKSTLPIDVFKLLYTLTTTTKQRSDGMDFDRWCNEYRVTTRIKGRDMTYMLSTDKHGIERWEYSVTAINAAK